MSNSISNYCRFIGRLVKDPKIIQVEDTHLTNFTLAINEYHKSKENQSEKGEFVKKKTVIILILKLGTLEQWPCTNIVRRATSLM